MQYLLGIDVGTSAVKTGLLALDGTLAAQSTKGYNVYYPHEGWAEQSPEDWWVATCAAIRALLEHSSISASEIVGIGIDGQSWSAIPIDGAGNVLHNTPIWMDTRAADICADLKARLGEQRIFDVCGNPLQPSYTLPKILWFAQNLPEVYKATDKILQSNSYIAYKLTGEITQDVSQGYGLQCFDMRSGRWDAELMRELGINPAMLPDIFPSHHIIGNVSASAARQSGLCAGIPVAAGGLDAACGALGAGVLLPGQTQEQGGQAGGMSICIDQYAAHPKLILSMHVAPGLWLLQGGTVGGGGALRWFESELGASERSEAIRLGMNAYEVLSKEAGEIAPGAEGVVFLPYMSGERSPIWNPNAKGVFFGLDYAKTREHMVRSVMEGVAYSLRHNIETAAEVGATVGEMRSMGGSANSEVWTQLKSDITGLPIAVPDSDSATILGAAMLAGVGVGAYGSFEQAVNLTVSVKRRHEPNTALRDVYHAGYAVYRDLYDSLSHLMN